MSETSATDIITYIGVPLAVLGVLPILYTFALSILTQRRIRHCLISHGHKPHTTRNNQEGFMLRASPMTSLIEVEMPRYTIAPVDRELGEYWEVSAEASTMLDGGKSGGHAHNHVVERVESTLSMLEEGRVRGFLKGGSWRTFNWRRLVVGRKMYRIQYEDELREPTAEIEFADLVNFLMDWGVELDGMGWEKLRSGGLWTPAGTVLLRVSDEVNTEAENGTYKPGSLKANRGDWVLRTSVPDDSDGILTLCVRWPPGRSLESDRNITSLPPGWGRLRNPPPPVLDDDEKPTSTTSSKHKALSETITTLTSTNPNLNTLPSLRFKLTNGLITTLHPELPNLIPTTLTLTLTHPTHSLEWFTAATSSLLTLSKTPTTGSLWGYHPSENITTFTQKESIPCGVLVLLGILPASLAPHWTPSTTTLPDLDLARQHQLRFQARAAAERLEAAMAPAQAAVHRQTREQEERRAQLDQMAAHLAAKRAAEHKRVEDALVSPRVGVKLAAEVCLAWLVDRGVVSPGCDLVAVVERVLYLIVVQAQCEGQEAGRVDVLGVLEEWVGWVAAGGMKREQFEMLERATVEFCCAVCVVALVGLAVGCETGQGKASVDMLECLRLWRKVRLG